MVLEVKRTPRGELVRSILLDLQELAGVVEERIGAIVREKGETWARYKVLTAAGCEPYTVPQIARRMGMTRQGVQRVVNKLVSDGLARTQENPDHAKSPIIVLTQAGECIDNAISTAIAKDNNEIGRSMSTRELKSAAEGVLSLIEVMGQAND